MIYLERFLKRPLHIPDTFLYFKPWLRKSDRLDHSQTHPNHLEVDLKKLIDFDNF